MLLPELGPCHLSHLPFHLPTLFLLFRGWEAMDSPMEVEEPLESRGNGAGLNGIVEITMYADQ